MKHFAIGAAVGAVLAATAFDASAMVAPPVSGAILIGYQSGFLDGDTLTIGGVRVLLKGVTAPELDTPEGQAAAAFLESLVAGTLVRCTLTADTTDKRAKGFCEAGGRDLNAAMVSSGHARACRRYIDSYVPLEAKPRALAIGVWATGYALPAYCYVKTKR